jgi:UDP-galactopyranose mutase
MDRIESNDAQAQRSTTQTPLNGGGRSPLPGTPDLVCLSHLRWDFVYQRPQHLLSRYAQDGRVFYIEEPVFGPCPSSRLEVHERQPGLWLVVPHLPGGLSTEQADASQQALIYELFARYAVREYVLWYYTPMAVAFTRHLMPLAIVYDCMDELSAFKGAPPPMRVREAELFTRADLVFTGGQSLYEAKCGQHPHVHAFPSSIDVSHFARARRVTQDPEDQAHIPHPRLGFFGVIDERMDVNLLRDLADARPAWHVVMIGPVVKIDAADLPRRPNIHYLGGKAYSELPAYLSGWDVALLPFARNESTRFISPTKTLEYLAGGKPVISTPIYDVVRPYGELGLVRIAETVAAFVAAVECALQQDTRASDWLRRVDAFLAQTSWDRTWAHMAGLLEPVIAARRPSSSWMRLHSELANPLGKGM